MSRASFRYRVADRANAVVWRLPLPRRLRALLSRIVYRNPPMPATRVVETLEALDSAGVETVVMGGWGISALSGAQQRTHRDLDLIVDRGKIDEAMDALQGLGYEEWYRDSSPAPFGDVEIPGDGVVVRDARLQAVDIHPIDLAEAELDVVRGAIGGGRVLCVSAEQQIRAHRGYTKRSRRERRCHEANLAAALTAHSRSRAAAAGYPGESADA